LLRQKFLLAPLGAVAVIGLIAFAQSGFGQAQQVVMLQPINLQPDIARGQILAETCMGCHGVPGYRNTYPAFHVPRLGGQNADYMEIALQAYRVGQREHGSMHGQAAVMSDQDVVDLAAYFASYEGRATTGRALRRGGSAQAGEQKAATCVACHGADGMAPSANWPHLAGQHASYLVHTMREYRSGVRQDLVMQPMAAGLSDEDINDLAAFYSSLPGLFNTVR
jgi:cytochrome c553